jgi:hypothetical protein
MDDLGPDPQRVASRTDLVAFVGALRDDLHRNPDQWENPDLDRFLEALARWVDDMPGWFKHRHEPEPEQPSWQLIAHILHAAAIYE